MKIKKTIKKSSVGKKKITTSTRPKSEKPWVKVLNMDVNPENPRNGFFELDWNDGDDEERKDNELFVYAVISQFDERSSQTFDRRIMGNIQKYMTR